MTPALRWAKMRAILKCKTQGRLHSLSSPKELNAACWKGWGKKQKTDGVRRWSLTKQTVRKRERNLQKKCQSNDTCNNNTPCIALRQWRGNSRRNINNRRSTSAKLIYCASNCRPALSDTRESMYKARHKANKETKQSMSAACGCIIRVPRTITSI